MENVFMTQIKHRDPIVILNSVKMPQKVIEQIHNVKNILLHV